MKQIEIVKKCTKKWFAKCFVHDYYGTIDKNL